MTTNIILFCISLYIVLGLIFFATVWKRVENEECEWGQRPRSKRIFIRVVVIAVWGLILAAVLIHVIYDAIRGLWKMITE